MTKSPILPKQKNKFEKIAYAAADASQPTYFLSGRLELKMRTSIRPK